MTPFSPRISTFLLSLAALGGCDSATSDPWNAFDEGGDSLTPRVEVGDDDTSDPIRNAVVRVGGCTGTLVDVDKILTAAHCGYDRDEWRGGAWFTLPSPDSVSFGPDRDAPIGSSNVIEVSLPPLATGGPDWEEDIALLRLAAPVPPKIAVPRAVFLDHPGPLLTFMATNPTIVQIGYGGGRDRRIMTGREYADWYVDSALPNNGFRYEADELGVGTRGTNIESGDSGGPMFLEHDTSPVMGVLSHWTPYGIAAYGGGGGGRPSIRSWITPLIPAQKPDLEVASIDVAGCSGSDPQIEVLIRNRGAVTESVLVDLFTGEPSPPAIGATGDYTDVSWLVQPYGETTVTFTITNGFVLGRVDVLLDSDEHADEIREDNNGGEAYLPMPKC